MAPTPPEREPRPSSYAYIGVALLVGPFLLSAIEFLVASSSGATGDALNYAGFTGFACGICTAPVGITLLVLFALDALFGHDDEPHDVSDLRRIITDGSAAPEDPLGSNPGDPQARA